jgi:hypothetical protein
MFVLMVLSMITVRTAGVLLRARAVNATVNFGSLNLARRFAR